MNFRIKHTAAQYEHPLPDGSVRTFKLTSDGAPSRFFEIVADGLDHVAQATSEHNQLDRVTGAHVSVIAERFALLVRGPVDADRLMHDLFHSFRLLEAKFRFHEVRVEQDALLLWADPNPSPVLPGSDWMTKSLQERRPL